MTKRVIIKLPDTAGFETKSEADISKLVSAAAKAAGLNVADEVIVQQGDDSMTDVPLSWSRWSRSC